MVEGDIATESCAFCAYCTVTVTEDGKVAHEPECLWVRHEALLELVEAVDFDKIRRIAQTQVDMGSQAVKIAVLQKFLSSERKK